MRRWSAPLSILLLLASAGLARAAPGGAGPLTGFEAGPFARAAAVLLAHVERVVDVVAPGGAAGRQVVSVKVRAAYKGSPRVGDALTVLVLGQRPTLDPSRPSVPYFAASDHGTYVLFLSRGQEDFAWKLQSLLGTDGAVGADKVHFVERVAAWAAVGDVQAKAARVRKDLLAMLGAPRPWARAQAARELAWLARVRPETFDHATVERLQSLVPGAHTPDERFWLQRTVTELRTPRAQRDEAARAAGGDPWRGAFLRAAGPQERRALLERVLGGPKGDDDAWWAWRRLEPSLRSWFVQTLVGAGRHDATAALREAYSGEDDPHVQTQLVRAVGLLGGKADVSWLAARLASLRLRKAALLALARVRTPEALARLRQVRSLSGRDEAAWIDYLLSPDFVADQRRAAGH
jgi:hypothetical protein